MIPFGDVLIALEWLGVLYACSMLGALVFLRPSKYFLLRYSFGKVIGIVGLGALTWLLSLLHIMPFIALWIWLIIIVLYALVLALRRKIIWTCLKQHWRELIVVELVFISLFIIGIALRVSNPDMNNIEKPMDAAILSNLLRHTTGVPVDTWYAGESINYYYFGHWLIAMLAKLSRTSLAYAFNLGFASVLAIAGSSLFVLGWRLAKQKLAGFLALFLAFFASNLHPFWMILNGHKNYFFFNSGRFIEQVINEYPLYSLILGDLHAHMLALVLSIGVYLGVALLYLEKLTFKKQIVLTSVIGGLVGLLSATNSFDVISCSIIFGLAIALMRWRKKTDNYQTICMLVAYGLAFIVLTFVFMTHFAPAIGGIGVALFKTPLIHVFWQFGLPVILGIAARAILFKKGWFRRYKYLELVYVFGIAGLILIILPQIIFLKDIYYFQNPPFARANTVFKMWYAAWPLIALTTAVFVSALSRAIKQKIWRYVWQGTLLIACAILAFGLYIGLKGLGNPAPNTLNGLEYINSNEPTKAEILNWVNKNITGQPIILQLPGQSYTNQSWLSNYSGLSTIIGWQSHEWGWRYDDQAWNLISQRVLSVKTIYESTNIDDLRSKINKLNIAYILIGPDEKQAYTINEVVFSQTFGEPIFSNSKYSLYVVNR